MLAEADEALRNKKYKDALRLFRLSLENKEDPAASYRGLCVSAYRLHMYERAEAYARSALEIRPDLYQPHLILAYIASRQGDLDRSMAEVRKALEVSPLEPDVLSFGGGILLGQDRVEDGWEMLQQAVQQKGDDWILHFNRGAAYARRRQYTESTREYLRSFGMHASWLTLRILLTVLAYRYRMVVAIVAAITVLAAYALRSLFLLAIPTVPTMLVGVIATAERSRKGPLMVLLGLAPILIFFLIR